MYYNLIASAEESTVLAQYVREERAPYAAYQSEAALERAQHPDDKNRKATFCNTSNPLQIKISK